MLGGDFARETGGGGGSGSIELAALDSRDLDAEGYTLRISDSGIRIAGADRAGVLYGSRRSGS